MERRIKVGPGLYALLYVGVAIDHDHGCRRLSREPYSPRPRSGESLRQVIRESIHSASGSRAHGSRFRWREVFSAASLSAQTSPTVVVTACPLMMVRTGPG